MRARALAVVLSSLVGGCIDSEFLRGARCGDDRDCGRSLSCEQQVCGGCPPRIPLVDGHCSCPGGRVLDCRLLDAPHCMPVCPFAQELCEVVEVKGDGSTEVVPACDEIVTPGRCFEVRLDAPECEGDAKIRLQPDDSMVKLVVNCPPPESEESHFDCMPP